MMMLFLITFIATPSEYGNRLAGAPIVTQCTTL
jgi:hypothetical protein